MKSPLGQSYDFAPTPALAPATPTARATPTRRGFRPRRRSRPRPRFRPRPCRPQPGHARRRSVCGRRGRRAGVAGVDGPGDRRGPRDSGAEHRRSGLDSLGRAAVRWSARGGTLSDLRGLPGHRGDSTVRGTRARKRGSRRFRREQCAVPRLEQRLDHRRRSAQARAVRHRAPGAIRCRPCGTFCAAAGPWVVPVAARRTPNASANSARRRARRCIAAAACLEPFEYFKCI